MIQNRNESFNGVLCGRCPRTKFCGRQKVELAVSETVMNLIMVRIQKYPILQHLLHYKDGARLTGRKARAKKKPKKDKGNCNSYMAGVFGTSKTPEVLSVQPIRKTRATFGKKM